MHATALRRLLNLLFIAALSGALSACALFGAYPSSPEAQATYHVKQAREALDKQHADVAGDQMELALLRPTGGERLRELFASRPDAAVTYATHLETRAARLANVAQARHYLKVLEGTRSAALLPQARIQSLERLAADTLVEANRAGAIPFTLDDDLADFPMLQADAPYRIIVDRSTDQLIHGGGRPLKGVLQHVERVGKDSAEGRRVLALLPKMNIRRGELDLLATYHPDYAAKRREELTTRAVLVVSQADRLVLADILDALRPQTPGIEWSTDPQPNHPTVTVERIRHNERVLPERVQTIVYGNHQIYPYAADRYMPRGAAYLYDVVTDGAEIEYGYAVIAHVSGQKTHDQLVRGSVGGEGLHCRNARVQNVYGGIAPAGFTANRDMERRCRGTRAESMEALRQRVFGEIVREIMEVPFVKQSLEMQ